MFKTKDLKMYCLVSMTGNFHDQIVYKLVTTATILDGNKAQKKGEQFFCVPDFFVKFIRHKTS